MSTWTSLDIMQIVKMFFFVGELQFLFHNYDYWIGNRNFGIPIINLEHTIVTN